MILVILKVLVFSVRARARARARARVCVCVCVAFIYSPLIVIMCDISFKQTYQIDSHINIFKDITSDHLVVPLTAECNHILLTLSFYAKIRSAVDS